MLSVEECRKRLEGFGDEFTDQEIEEKRDFLMGLINELWEIFKM